MGVSRRNNGQEKEKVFGFQRTHEETTDLYAGLPKTFVFRLGRVGYSLKQLTEDLREVMLPCTAKNLRSKKSNVLKDFLAVAGPLNISHFNFFTRTDNGAYFKIAKFPHGPTFTFALERYSLSHEVRKLHLTSHAPVVSFQSPPLLILNGFTKGGKHIQLLAVLLQNMFPSININTVTFSQVRRVVLFHYDHETDKINFRHFLINLNPKGVTKGVKRIAQEKVPDLSTLEDISDYVLAAAKPTESDREDDPENEVSVPKRYPGRLNRDARYKKGSIRLTELGPRMDMKVLKIEEGMSDGLVQYHAFVKKSPEELAEMKKKQLKKVAKQKAKEKARDASKKKEMEKARTEQYIEKSKAKLKEDEEYYREEVGDEPDEAFYNKEEKVQKDKTPHWKKKKTMKQSVKRADKRPEIDLPLEPKPGGKPKKRKSDGSSIGRSRKAFAAKNGPKQSSKKKQKTKSRAGAKSSGKKKKTRK